MHGFVRSVLYRASSGVPREVEFLLLVFSPRFRRGWRRRREDLGKIQDLSGFTTLKIGVRGIGI